MSYDGWADATRPRTSRRQSAKPDGLDSTTSASTCCTTFRPRRPTPGAVSLVSALDLEPEHVSAYALSLDDPDAEGLTGPSGDHLPLRAGARQWRNRARLEQDEERGGLFLRDGRLRCWQPPASTGTSCRTGREPGRESRHNLGYWQGSAWEAVGPGAHAFDGARTRRWNARPAGRLRGRAGSRRWIGQPVATRQHSRRPTSKPPSPNRRSCASGPVTACRPRLQVVPSSAQPLPGREQIELAEPRADGAVRLTVRGRLLSNELSVRLLPDAKYRAA